ncbi:MAG: Hsp70 family protein [Proteobacteria bacterium]|nr:Hsp70 family protein [Pseudomonadota bacterium]
MIIGIDLGTTNSVLAVWKAGKAELIPNSFGEYLTPSVVSIEKDGTIHIGKTAKTRALLKPLESAVNFKRYMGSDKQYRFHTKSFSPIELSALLLKRLLEDAENHLSEKISEAVISVPAYFNGIQRKATKQAAELAGLKVEKLINEPTAAAIAYGLQDKPEYTDFMVIDLGGGTFDVSIMEYFDGVLEVKASSGDNFLGGEDFLQVMIDHYISKAGIKPNKLSAEDRQKINLRIEQAKRQISANKNHLIEPFLNIKSSPVDFVYSEIVKLCEPLLQKIIKPIERCLKDSKLEPVDMDEIILVGGASRMVFFKSIITRMFKKIPRTDIDPDQTVAIGAAIQGGLKAKDQVLGDVVLTDVCPYTLGTGVVNSNDIMGTHGLLFDPIIERNTIIPVSRVKSYVTASDNQKSLVLDIYQGESRLVKNNIKLGVIEVNIPKAKAGEQRVELRFSYDVNGLLEVDAHVPSTDQSYQKVINNSPGELSQKEIDKSHAKLSGLKVHPRENEQAIELIMRAESLFEDSIEEDRILISNALGEFERILERQDLKEIAETTTKFNEFLAEFDNSGWFE